MLFNLIFYFSEFAFNTWKKKEATKGRKYSIYICLKLLHNTWGFLLGFFFFFCTQNIKKSGPNFCFYVLGCVQQLFFSPRSNSTKCRVLFLNSVSALNGYFTLFFLPLKIVWSIFWDDADAVLLNKDQQVSWSVESRVLIWSDLIWSLLQRSIWNPVSNLFVPTSVSRHHVSRGQQAGVMGKCEGVAMRTGRWDVSGGERVMWLRIVVCERETTHTHTHTLGVCCHSMKRSLLQRLTLELSLPTLQGEL